MKTITQIVCFAALAAVANAQQKIPEPVPILKQISKQNDDGSYSFGYEAGDGSFKIETKYPDGSVQGKYGYVDDSGKLREVEYGASKSRGFEPSGNDINVPPPTVSRNENVQPLADGEEDDGQYREDPRIYESKEYRNNLPAQKPAARRPATQFRFQEPVQQTYQEPAQNTYTTFPQPARQSVFEYQTTARPAYSGVQQTFPRFQSVFQNYEPQQQFYQQPQYQQPQYQQPQYQQYQQPQYQTYNQPAASQFVYNGHPSVRNFDLGTGSYSINYSGRR